MQPENRITSIKICEKSYPLNYCMRNANEISTVIEEKPDERFGAYGSIAKNIHVLWLLMRDGAEYMRRFHGEETELPQQDDLLTLFSPGDNARIVAAVQEAIKAGGMRLVEVAEKKE